jgi:Protein O-mannosyl-transferase TMEM260-like
MIRDSPRDAGRSRWAVPLAVVAIALLVYLRTLLPGMAFDDWGEMQTVPHVLGVPHPTGYPTYVLTAWLFELLPVGSIAFRANLLSAVCIALAMGLLTSILQRLDVRPAIAAAAALATGFTGALWTSAEVAEVNPLHVLFIALIAERALAWAEAPRLRDLALGGLLIGLSLGNHVLTAFVAPFLVLFVLWAGRRELLAHPAWLLAPVATLALGLSVYAYLPIAASFHPPLPYNDPVTFDRFKFLVMGEQFRGQYGNLFTTTDIGPYLASLPDLWSLAVERATVFVPALGVVGLVLLLWRRPAFALACWGILILGTYVWASYLRLEHYLLVPWLVIGIGAGVAVEAGARSFGWLLDARLGPTAWSPAGSLSMSLRAAPTTIPVLAGAMLAVALVAVNLPSADRSGDHSAETYVDAVFAALPQGSAILSYWGASAPLWHATLVEGRRPDILVVDDTNIVYEGWGTRENRIASLICTRPVFILHLSEAELAPTREQFRLTQVARLFIAGGTPTATAYAPLYRVDLQAGTCQ